MKTNQQSEVRKPGSAEEAVRKSPAKPFLSPGQAKREKAKLRQFREEAESEPISGNADVRSSITGQY